MTPEIGAEGVFPRTSKVDKRGVYPYPPNRESLLGPNPEGFPSPYNRTRRENRFTRRRGGRLEDFYL